MGLFGAAKRIDLAEARHPGAGADGAPLPPLKARFSPRLARALFMSLLMHHRHPPEGGLDPWPVADREAACADAF